MKAKVTITLGDTIDNTEGLTRNKVAVEGKLRPATISELCNGKSKSISFETLTRIIEAMNDLTGNQYRIEDVIKVEYE